VNAPTRDPGDLGVAHGTGPAFGRKPTYGPEKIQAIIDTTLQSKPKGQTQWSCRSLAQRLGFPPL
jgi:hypothetical protein